MELCGGSGFITLHYNLWRCKLTQEPYVSTEPKYKVKVNGDYGGSLSNLRSSYISSYKGSWSQMAEARYIPKYVNFWWKVVLYHCWLGSFDNFSKEIVAKLKLKKTHISSHITYSESTWQLRSTLFIGVWSPIFLETRSLVIDTHGC